MPLPQDQVTAGLLAELESFERLIRSLSDEELAKASRCEGWAVADVASHVIGGLADVIAGRLDGVGTPEYTQRQVDERRGRTATELADELSEVRNAAAAMLPLFDATAWEGPAPGGYDGTIGDGVEALWYDTYIHADDIRAAIGQPSELGDGLTASVSHIASELTKRGWGPATLAMSGLPEFSVGTGGRRIEGEPLAFVLAATGRADAAPLGLDPTVNIYA